MATKRRRSGSKGGGTLGCAPFLVLIVIALIIQYWWVLLIAAGMVALTVALVRSTKAPPRPARVPPPKPQPVVPPPRPLAGDDLTARMRAQKQVSRVRDMQEWDYEWIRLAHPGKSSREVNEIANAHFARGRSIGINWGDPSAP